MDIINKCLKILFKNKKYKVYYETMIYISGYIKNASAINKTEEAFFILDNLYNPFVEQTDNLAKQTDIPRNNMFYLYIPDAYISLYTELLLSFNSSKYNIEVFTIKKIMKHDFIYKNINLPNNIIKKLEEIKIKLQFECLIEKSLKTTDWYIQGLLIDCRIDFIKTFYDNLFFRILKNIEIYSNDKFIEQNADISIVLVSRTYELYYKLSHSLKITKASFKKDDTFISQQKNLLTIKDNILQMIVKLSPYLKASDKQNPDFLGSIYLILHTEIRDIILNKEANNGNLLENLFNTMNQIIKLQFADIGRELIEITKPHTSKITIQDSMNWYANKSIELLIDLMDLSGYIYLFDDIYKKSFKNNIKPVWENMLAEKGIDHLFNIINSSEIYSFNTPNQSNLQFNLQKIVINKLQELSLKKEYNSKLLEHIALQNYRLNRDDYRGYLIFIVKFLWDFFNDGQKTELLKNWKINSCHKRIYDETK